MSGLLAGVSNSIIVAPIELCRTRTIISKDGEAASAAHVIRTICREDGFFSLWRGLGATVLRDGLLALPIDTVKTLIEASSASRRLGQGVSLRSVTKALQASQGGLSRVVAAYPLALLRGVPASVVTLLTYDMVMELLE